MEVEGKAPNPKLPFHCPPEALMYPKLLSHTDSLAVEFPSSDPKLYKP